MRRNPNDIKPRPAPLEPGPAPKPSTQQNGTKQILVGAAVLGGAALVLYLLGRAAGG
jgi:hypothetical protein